MVIEKGDRKHRVGGKEITFVELLGMKKFREPFAVFCEEIFCEENILFYNDVVELEGRSSSLDDEEFAREAKRIYATYLRYSAPHEVNVDNLYIYPLRIVFDAPSITPSPLPPSSSSSSSLFSATSPLRSPSSSTLTLSSSPSSTTTSSSSSLSSSSSSSSSPSSSSSSSSSSFLFENRKFTRDIFEGVKISTVKLMELDSFPKFTKTDVFQDLLEELNWEALSPLMKGVWGGLRGGWVLLHTLILIGCAYLYCCLLYYLFVAPSEESS